MSFNTSNQMYFYMIPCQWTRWRGTANDRFRAMCWLPKFALCCTQKNFIREKTERAHYFLLVLDASRANVELVTGHFLRHVQYKPAVSFVGLAQQATKLVEKACIFA